MAGYAQQGKLILLLSLRTFDDVVASDAEECYSFIIQTLRNVPGLTSDGTSIATSAQAEMGSKRFVEQYMMGEMRRVYAIPFPSRCTSAGPYLSG